MSATHPPHQVVARPCPIVRTFTCPRAGRPIRGVVSRMVTLGLAKLDVMDRCPERTARWRAAWFTIAGIVLLIQWS